MWAFGDIRLPGRFWDKVAVEFDDRGCWFWTAAKLKDGYGAAWMDGRTTGAHRLAFTKLVGPIPDGLQLDHLCRVRNCVNPAHLEPVTTRENSLRGDTFQARNAAKKHCINGHPFDAANTFLRKDRPTSRDCRECRRAASERYIKRRSVTLEKHRVT